MARARESGELEREVLACLAAHGAAMTPREVRDDLGGDLAYTTVMTTLTRLHAKRAVAREPRGRAYAYSLPDGTAGAQASVAAFHMQRLLDAEADRAGVLARFVEHLAPGDGRLLARLLGDRGEGRGGTS